MPSPEIEISPLGGVGEFGKNALVVRYNGDAIVVDAGISFPDESMPGIDRISPDFSPLARENVVGIFLTHGHEDHIGALSFLLEETRAKVYATAFTRALSERRLAEEGVRASFETAEFGRGIEAGAFTVTLLPVSHSVPQSAALLIEAGGRRVFHTGDFKIDADSPPGEGTDLEDLARRARGCDLLLLDSTNADRPGECGSERLAREGVTAEIAGAGARVILTTFSSHVVRVAGALEAARASGRRSAVFGKSLREILDIGERFGYATLPADFLTRREGVGDIPRNRLFVLCAGSQGEPLSALSRLAGAHDPDLPLEPGDRVIFSSRTIPGRERAVSRVVDQLLHRGATVARGEAPGRLLHVSGHAFRGDLHRLVRALEPRAVLPVHGERQALAECGAMAREAGVDAGRVFLTENGDSLFLGEELRVMKGLRGAGCFYLDASTGARLTASMLRERRLLASDGVLAVSLAIEDRTCRIEVGSKGLAVGGKDFAAELEHEVRLVFTQSTKKERQEAEMLREKIETGLRRYIRRTYGFRPLIVVLISTVVKT